MTQEGLAEAATVSPRSVSDLERGVNQTARRGPTVDDVNADMPPDDPLAGQDRNNGGFFINLRPDDPDSAERRARHEAAIRTMTGDDAFEAMRRSQALSRNPRPLSGPEKAVLREAVAPLLRDLAAMGQALPDIREEAHEDRGRDGVCAWIAESGNRGQGITVRLNCDEPGRLYFLAEQLQSWKNGELIDAGQQPWPQCPDHAGECTLSPDLNDEAAVWRCPTDGRAIAIGTLGKPNT